MKDLKIEQKKLQLIVGRFVRYFRTSEVMMLTSTKLIRS
jgi:hypothetical protein